MIDWKPIHTLDPSREDWVLVYDANATKHSYKIARHLWNGAALFAPQSGVVSRPTHWAELTRPEGFRVKLRRKMV